MGLTLHEAAARLEPAITIRQLTALAVIADIEPTGRRHTGQPGRPPNIYDADELAQAHATEANRTIKQFTDNDWLASALLARDLITTDTDNGHIWWTDGTRAERLGPGNYGYIYVGHERVPAHRVIWIAAEGEIPPGLQINHRNRRRWDNRRTNLELVTFINNIRHAQDGIHYTTYHQAKDELATLNPPVNVPEPVENLTRIGGTFRRN
jgi:hypothetical protein